MDRLYIVPYAIPPGPASTSLIPSPRQGAEKPKDAGGSVGERRFSAA
ncbi:MAG TPA: hypothetical protein VNO32_36720 [Candidatus Acidoferrum sp.]|nr:hypothetical protein [Candidatus Acidoferrum sp.]